MGIFDSVPFEDLFNTFNDGTDALIGSGGIVSTLVFPTRGTTAPTLDIRTLVINDPSKWMFQKNNMVWQTPEGTVQLIGFVSDLPDLLRADYVIVNSPQSGILRTKFTRRGQPSIEGFRMNRYFSCILERV